MLWVLIIGASLIGAMLLLALYTFQKCFYSPTNRNEDPFSHMPGKQYAEVYDNIIACTRIVQKTPCDRVYIHSFDGLKLSGQYYHTADGAPLMLQFHGYRSMSVRDCAGGHMLAKKMGFNVLSVDQRAHGDSDGNVISFGICERKDCFNWVKYAVERFGKDVKIVLSGLSMGAATVLMASEMNLPENVVAIIADCPYSSPGEIIRKVSRDRGLPDNLAYPFIRLGAKIYGGFSLEESSAKDAVRHAKLPILLLHGEEDHFVPMEMSKQIAESCSSRVELHLFSGAGHGLCYMIDPVRYETVTVRFLWSIPALRDHMEQNPFCLEYMEQ